MYQFFGDLTPLLDVKAGSVWVMSNLAHCNKYTIAQNYPRTIT